MGGTHGRLGRFVQRIVEPTERPYRCRGCGTRYDLQYHVCPECGGYSVEPEPGRDLDLLE